VCKTEVRVTWSLDQKVSKSMIKKGIFEKGMQIRAWIGGFIFIGEVKVVSDNTLRLGPPGVMYSGDKNAVRYPTNVVISQISAWSVL
jgi:hypothetical protein